MDAWVHFAIFLPFFLLLAVTERDLRDHQWAYSAVEDQLVSFPAEETTTPTGWVHITGSGQHLTVAPTLTDADFAVSVPGALRLQRKTEYCQWVETKHETCSTITGDDGESQEECELTYTYQKKWTSSPVPSNSFYEHGHNNPQHDPYPTRLFVTPNLKIGDTLITPEIITTFEGAEPTTLSADSQAAVSSLNAASASSAAAHAGFSPLMNDHKSMYGLYSEYRHSRSAHKSNDAAGCSSGDIRIQWTFSAPTELTAIGQVTPTGLKPIQTANSPQLVGILQEGLLSPKAAFEGRLSPLVYWQVLPARLLLLAFTVAEAYFWSHSLGLWWANSNTFAALVVSLGSCSAATILALLWSFIYGLADWQGRETSAPQIQLLVVCGSALMVLAAASRQAGSRVVTSFARISVTMHRVSESLFRIRNRSTGRPATDRLQTSGLFVAIVAGFLLSFTALTAGTSSAHWLMWAAGVVTTTLSLVLLVATFLTRERLTATTNDTAAGAVGAVEMDCPVCLDSVSMDDGLVLVPCGHTICSSCLGHMNRSSAARGSCPVCRTAVSNTISVSSRVSSSEFTGHFRGTNQ